MAALERSQYFVSHMSKLHPTQIKLRELTAKHPACRMLGSADSIMILATMIKFAGAKKCIDVGVYTGYSSLSWALAVPEDGKVVACDITDEYATIGKPVWKEAGVEQKIDLRIGAAANTLQSMIDVGEAGTFDFMFIDADKTGYDSYYELGLKLLRKGGIIGIDNTWWHGKLVDSSNNEASTVAIRAINNKITQDDRVTAVLVDSGDGIHICLKN